MNGVFRRFTGKELADYNKRRKTIRFDYYNAHAFPADNANTYMAVIDEVYSKQDLLEQLNEKLKFPYFGFNWDALWDCLNDLAWIEKFNVILMHKELPHLNDNDLKIYLDIVNLCIDRWENERHSFAVYFPESDKEKITEIFSTF